MDPSIASSSTSALSCALDTRRSPTNRQRSRRRGRPPLINPTSSSLTPPCVVSEHVRASQPETPSRQSRAPPRSASCSPPKGAIVTASARPARCPSCSAARAARSTSAHSACDLARSGEDSGAQSPPRRGSAFAASRFASPGAARLACGRRCSHSSSARMRLRDTAAVLPRPWTACGRPGSTTRTTRRFTLPRALVRSAAAARVSCGGPQLEPSALFPLRSSAHRPPRQLREGRSDAAVVCVVNDEPTPNAAAADVATTPMKGRGPPPARSAAARGLLGARAVAARPSTSSSEHWRTCSCGASRLQRSTNAAQARRRNPVQQLDVGRGGRARAGDAGYEEGAGHVAGSGRNSSARCAICESLLAAARAAQALADRRHVVGLDRRRDDGAPPARSSTAVAAPRHLRRGQLR